MRSIVNILSSGSESTQMSETHPHLSAMKECNGIEELYSVYENNGDQTCQNLASICIGHLFRGQEIENKKQNIIDNLKQLLIDSDVWIREASQRSLKDLAQNLENRNEIMTGDFMKNMARDLQCKISGNDEQKNETMLQQEKYCKILHISLQGREDDDLRKKALNCGVIESILHILEQRDLSQITHPYILVFYSILTPSNESIKQLILSKKPYNGLTRILFHSDNNICLDSIKSIDILLSYKTDSSSYCDSNPQFNVMQECSGLEKILSIFQRSNVKQIKDISSFCIGRLFEGRQIDNVIIKKEILFHLKRLIIDSELQTNITSKSILMGLVKNEVNRSEILKSDLIKNIVEDLKQPPKGDAIKKQEMSCELILRLFKDKEDEQGRLIVIDGKIIDTFINIFEKRELILISRPYCEAFNCLLAPANDAVKLKIFGKKPYSGLLRILDHEDINILEDILYSIFILLSSGLNTVQHSQVHPHYKVIQQYGGTEKIIQLFKNNKNKRTKDFSSICFSFLYKAREITDSFQKNEIIPHLKTLIYDQDVQIKKNARIGLTLLAENKLNCEEILKGNFLNDIVHGLRNEYGEGKQTLEQEKLSGQCEFLTDLIVVCKNDDVRKICIQAGIGDALFRFIESQDLNSILQSQLYTNTLFTLLNGGSDIRQQLFDIKPYPSLLHLLQHPNSEVIFQSICQILKFLISGSIGVQYQSLHPHIPIMQDNNGIEKIFDLFKRNLDKETKDYSSICIGYLFKGQQIIDIEMKQVLLHLIRIIYDNNEYIKANSKQGLKFLAENPDNCEQILKSDFLKNISEYLRQPIEGNDQQKKGILNKQQTGCEIIYAIFNGREDSQGRQNTIDIGIVDQLIRILNNYKMNIISEAYVNALLSISGPASDQIKEQIVAKKAYQSLIRIFDHNKIEVINSSIQIIDNLLSVYENKELDLSTHPHFDQMQQYNGIDKIYQLFKKNMNKDIRNRSALCIGRLYCAQSINNQIMKVEVITHLKKLTEDPILQDSAYKRLLELAQNDGNRIEIMNSTMLKGIALDLQKEIIGSEDNINEIKERQFKLCNFLISLMKRLEDQEIMKLVISSGISQSLTIMFQKRDLESITRIFSQTFYNITAASKVDARVMIFEKQPFPGLIRLLNHSNIDIVSDSLNSIMNIVLAGTETTIETNVHPYFNEVNGCNGIEAIYSIFQQNINNDLKNTSAILFGHLYRSREIKDINQRIEIISHLKTLLNNSNIEIKKNGKNAIVDLGQNEINRADILSIEFLKSISDDLQIRVEGSNEQILEINCKQQFQCELLTQILKGKKDAEIRKNCIETKIVKSLINIYQERKINQITPSFSELFLVISQCSNDIVNLLFDEKPFEGLIRLFENPNKLVVSHSINSLFNIVCAGASTQSTRKPNPHLELIEQYEGINQLFTLFLKNSSKDISDKSALIIGILFRQRLIENSIIRSHIILHLQQLTNDSNQQTRYLAQSTFDGLMNVFENRSALSDNDQIALVVRDLMIPLQGATAEQKQDILIIQDYGFKYLFSLIEDQDKMGRLLIDQGVIDTIIYILETRDLPDINRKLLSIIGYICLSSDDDSMYIVQRKNPFPGLIRLFNHAEEKTINTSIEIIFYILLAAHRKTEAKSLHPYFDNVASVGIEKILELFRRTTDKETRDYSAGSLGIVFRARAINDPTMRHEIIQYCRALLYDPEKKLSSMGLCALNCMAENKVNRSDFLYGISLQDMANDFGRPLYGNEEERNNIIRMQECHCTLIFSMFAGIEDDQLRQFVLNSYFPDSLLRMFEQRDLNTIKEIHIEAFFQLTLIKKDEARAQISWKRPFPGLLRLLNHSEIIIVEKSLFSLYNIIKSGMVLSKRTEETHPHFQAMQECQGIEKIYALFQRNLKKDIKDTSAECIGYLHKNRQIQNKYMQRDVIMHLIRLIRDSDQTDRGIAQTALIYLALNNNNQQFMISIGFDPMTLL